MHDRILESDPNGDSNHLKENLKFIDKNALILLGQPLNNEMIMQLIFVCDVIRKIDSCISYTQASLSK